MARSSASAKPHPGCGLGVPPRRRLYKCEPSNFSRSLVAVPHPNNHHLSHNSFWPRKWHGGDAGHSPQFRRPAHSRGGKLSTSYKSSLFSARRKQICLISVYLRPIFAVLVHTVRGYPDRAGRRWWARGQGGASWNGGAAACVGPRCGARPAVRQRSGGQ